MLARLRVTEALRDAGETDPGVAVAPASFGILVG